MVETVGIFTKDKRRIVRYDGKKVGFPAQHDDPYDRIMKA